MQALGASGALHMGAKFLRAHYEPYLSRAESKVYIPLETWTNHPNVFQSVGFTTASLPWYNEERRAFDLTLFQSEIVKIPSQSIVVLQISANNPTGCDPSVDEWRQIALTFKSCGHFAFLDLAYPGFVSGCFVTDALPLRIFVDTGVPLATATTYGKAFGLYGERVGHLCFTLPDAHTAQRAEQQMKLLARAETGAQPRFGAALVALILGNKELKACWEKDIRRLAQDLDSRRKNLKESLVRAGAPGNWDFITNQRGMFT
ncbi:PLP-dependent transferase [Dissoconium aciculare CBS 342.82]|uniref:PLP-dependent transferase n=1 Tax=Dissoconium aciculare CBS 342.82 TaxID=1314786 RepID=A0A6J3M5G3_9PEZI|nr:PLP-dependent transferase [Dissoconium aciculare CBS 342.82]KAF1823290.1 PLP-dependent transferase [Dissoconium aciculare CBS 342.82]